MTILKAISLGITADGLAKQITGSDEVSVSRSALSTGIGAATGAAASGALVIAGVTAPVTVPLAVATGAVAFLVSLF